jgi:hypothetical protein
MPAANTHPSPQQKGEVRIRSNVCTDPNGWHLVPGDLVKSFSLSQRDLTPKQKREMMYYERCCLCHRTIFEIEEDGCDYCAQRGHGTLSVAGARRRQVQRLNQTEEAQF